MTIDRSLAAGSARTRSWSGPRSDSLADVLERVLDKGVVIVGDVVVSVLDVELLTLKLRLFIASADTAREMGLDWWTADPFFNSNARSLQAENEDLRNRLAALEAGGRPAAAEVGGRSLDREAVGPPGRTGEPIGERTGEPIGERTGERTREQRRRTASSSATAASPTIATPFRLPYPPWAEAGASADNRGTAGRGTAGRGSRHGRGDRR